MKSASSVTSVLPASCRQNPLPAAGGSRRQFDLPAGRQQHVSFGLPGICGCAILFQP